MTTVHEPPGDTIGDLFDASQTLWRHARSNVDRLVKEFRRDSTRVVDEIGGLYSATSSAAVEMQHAVRGTPRFTRIIREVARVVVGARLARAKAELVGVHGNRLDLDAMHARHAQRLYEMCVDLRGGVLKLGQFVSSRVDLLPQPYIDRLSRLQDRVPPVPSRDIRARVATELGRPIDDVFQSFDDQPIAAASLAQVHGARLLDGTEVAVKVQVPGIEEVLDIDLAACRVLARWLDDSMPGMNLPIVAAELERSVRVELDFRMEAANARGFAARFADWAHVHVPRVYHELSTGRMLVMERIDGVRIVDYLDQCHPGQRDALFATLLRAFAAQIVDHGVFHCDPHPGNFLVRGDGELVILDFGSVVEMPPHATYRYAAFLAAFVARDTAAMSMQLQQLGFVADSPDDLIHNASVFLDVFGPAMVSLDLAEIDPRRELQRALQMVRTHPVRRVPSEFVQLARVFGSLGGLFLRYRPRVQPLAILAPFLSRALQQPMA